MESAIAPIAPGDFYNQLVKVDVRKHTTKVWLAEDCYVGEPVFVAAPQATDEDDGVTLLLHKSAGQKGLEIGLMMSSTTVDHDWREAGIQVN